MNKRYHLNGFAIPKVENSIPTYVAVNLGAPADAFF